MEAKHLFACIIFTFLFISCNNGENQADELKGLDGSLKEGKNYLMPNDEFREKVLSKLSNPKDISVLDTLVTQLDKQNLSFCQFIKRMFEIDDSSYAIARAKFPKSSQQLNFSKEHSKSLKVLEPRYLNTIGVSHRQADIATTVYAFTKEAKILCGNY